MVITKVDPRHMTLTNPLTREETRKVVEAAILGSGGSLQEGQLAGAVRWARLARVQGKLLDAILAGEILIDLRGHEPVFRLPEILTLVGGNG